MTAVSFQLGARRVRLPEDEAVRLEQRLRAFGDATGLADDLAERIEMSLPRGHIVYPTRSELLVLAEALRDLGGPLSSSISDLLDHVLSEIG